MSNIFGIFNSGISGLMASQAGIDVTGHNIANINTAGYSRQTVSLTTQTPNISGSNVYGRGVQITSITRVYDEILARKSHTLTGSRSSASTHRCRPRSPRSLCISMSLRTVPDWVRP
ncbi:MAG: flagellar basal body protein [Geovibrio sp.]|nr:flagellar basal body protein [Geovibrio sp.]